MKNIFKKFQQFEVSGEKISGATYACAVEVAGIGWVTFDTEWDGGSGGDSYTYINGWGETTYCTLLPDQ